MHVPYQPVQRFYLKPEWFEGNSTGDTGVRGGSGVADSNTVVLHWLKTSQVSQFYYLPDLVSSFYL